MCLKCGACGSVWHHLADSWDRLAVFCSDLLCVLFYRVFLSILLLWGELSQVDNGSDVRQEKKEKKKKKGGDEVVLVYPEKAKSLKAKIRNCVMKILKDVDVINEKDLVLRLIFECEPAKEYYKKNNDTSYLRFIIWDMARKGMIKRAKIFGEGSRRYYLLPEKLEVLKDRVIGESD